MTDLRVLIADDHPVFRLGLAALISSLPGLTLVSEAPDGETAVDLVAEHRPDVVLMDLQLPKLSGIEATARIAADYPDVAVVMLTMHDTNDAVTAALRAGARGYLVKSADPDEMERAIRSAARGSAVLSADVADLLRDLTAAGHRAVQASALPDLTPRELDILGLVAAGYANHAIARRLGLSPKTVANNVANILVKLRVPDRAAAIARARAAGLGT